MVPAKLKRMKYIKYLIVFLFIFTSCTTPSISVKSGSSTSVNGVTVLISYNSDGLYRVELTGADSPVSVQVNPWMLYYPRIKGELLHYKKVYVLEDDVQQEYLIPVYDDDIPDKWIEWEPDELRTDLEAGESTELHFKKPVYDKWVQEEIEETLSVLFHFTVISGDIEEQLLIRVLSD